GGAGVTLSRPEARNLRGEMSNRDEVGHGRGPRESAWACSGAGRWLRSLAALGAAAALIGGCKSDDKPSPSEVVGAAEAPTPSGGAADASATDDVAASERAARVETRPPPPEKRTGDSEATAGVAPAPDE